MKLISLIDNETRGGCCAEHGLSLYLELSSGRKILFDMGQGPLFSENARKLGIDLGRVDTAVISHGHYDHGGGLETWLGINEKSRIYVRRDAFLPHFSVSGGDPRDIGLDRRLSSGERLVFSGDIEEIEPGAVLFSNVGGRHTLPPGDELLIGENGHRDSFSHEQNLLIKEDGRTFLFAGCAHAGILNIMDRAEEISDGPLDVVVAGLHLAHCDGSYVEKLAKELSGRGDCLFVTMHCTLWNNYLKMKDILGDRLEYLSCGQEFLY